MRRKLEAYFEFEALGATWKTEILAGFTTFMTMAYIVFVNPSILHETGMPLAGVTAATCLSAAVGSFLMGGLARYPIALAPGMGLNAYFTYAVVKGLGIPWQTALGAVFISGVVFLLLTALGLRQLILNAIPPELYAAVATGVGLFIALIGFRNSGIIAPNAATMVGLGNLANPSTMLAIGGLILTAALLAWRVRAAMLIGILATTCVGLLAGIAKWSPQPYAFNEMVSTFGKLDIPAALRTGVLEIIFVFLFIDLFDNLGTLVAVGKRANLFDEAHRIPRMNRILVSDATATIVGSFAGTSTVVSYIESAAGVAAGGRTGIPAIVTGALFVAALFVAPLMGAIPAAATGPALILVGSMMTGAVTEIDWQEPEIGIPAFLTITAIPLSFSIANGLALGFTAYALIKLLRGKFREVNWLVYLLAALFVLRFIYLSTG
jgi:adenine/guanine/hypoxanthine permease